MSVQWAQLHVELKGLARSDKAMFLARFFKAGPGQYAEGDMFLGITVPNIRVVIKPYGNLPLEGVEQLLTSKWHEERLAALLILVGQYKQADVANKKTIYEFYLSHTKFINNWDLVGSSAEFIVGPYLENRADKHEVLRELADSKLLWERRIAMLATFDYIKKGTADEALRIAEQLLYDKHDLIQKSVGWMLREIGKRVGRAPLEAFLDTYAGTMPRTSLRRYRALFSGT